jgi:PAS domain S-box-containing protein
VYAEAIVDTVREPLLVLDAELSVTSANRAFYAAFQATEKDTVGRSLYALGNHDWDIPQLRTMLAEVLPRRRVLNDFEVTHEFSSLGTRVMLLNARVIVRGGGRPDLILLAIEDLTERRRIQSALSETESRERIEGEIRQRQVQLAHALRVSTVGELASGLAHELNQPLSTIANDVEACARFVRSGSSDDNKLLALLRDASVEAVRASEIVEHLRQFIEKGEPEFERTDLTDTIHHMPRLLAHEIEREKIALRLDLPPDPLPVRIDRIQIEQVLVNLMQNAIDSTREAGVDCREIEVAARAVDGMAEVLVRDNGAGLSAESAARLFEPFFTTKSQGMGLGLSISRSIVEAHGGTIRIEPLPDGSEGTNLRFTLPLDVSVSARRRRSK